MHSWTAQAEAVACPCSSRTDLKIPHLRIPPRCATAELLGCANISPDLSYVSLHQHMQGGKASKCRTSRTLKKVRVLYIFCSPKKIRAHRKQISSPPPPPALTQGPPCPRPPRPLLRAPHKGPAWQCQGPTAHYGVTVCPRPRTPTQHTACTYATSKDLEGLRL